MGFVDSRLIISVLIAVPHIAWAGCDPAAVELRNANGSIARFHVEIADEPREQALGLMMRESLATSSGMLFVFDPPKHARFWMKNTLIPLDMIFADASGRVTRVHANATPKDETLVDGGDDVAFVLEISGGLAHRLGIAAGTAIRHPTIAQDNAIWSCLAP